MLSFPAVTLNPGTRIGPYEIGESLGEGGMASVYKAYEPDLERHVALKVLATELLREPQFAERFKREAKVSRGSSTRTSFPFTPSASTRACPGWPCA